jgi:hypothetical protein
MQIIACPDTSCLAPAEVVDHWILDSTDGPVEHLKTRCLAGHILTPRVESLTAQGTQVPDRRSRTG